MKTCLEYVLENLIKSEQEPLKEVLTNKTFFRNKSQIMKGDCIIFTHGFHVGFGVIDEYLNVITDECSDGQIFTRTLSLYDDRLKIAKVNPKRKRGKNNGKVE